MLTFKKVLVLGILCFSSVSWLFSADLKLNDIVVTGTKTERKIKDVPVKVEVIRPAEIKAKQAYNLYEALENIPGVRVEQQCSNCNFTILRMGGMSGGYTTVLLDGQPNFSALAQVYSLQQIGTANIDRIEIVKGAGSSLYGADAIAGVVNIIFKEPTKNPYSNFRVTLGTNGLRDYSALSSFRKNDIGLSVSVQRTEKDAIDENDDNFTDRVESDNLNAGLKLYLYNTLKENDKIILTGRAYKEFRRGGNVENNKWEDPLDDDAEHIKTRRYEGGITYKSFFENNKWIEANLTLSSHYRNATNGAAWELFTTNVQDAGYGYADDNGIHGITFYDTIPGGFTHDSMAQIIEWRAKPYISDEDMFIANLTYGFPVGKANSFIAGIQYKKEKLYQSINLTRTNQKSRDIGFYLQDEWVINNRLEAVIGGRYDKHHSEDDTVGSENYDENEFSPRLALKYSATEKLNLRFNFGTGFKVPTQFAEDMHLCASSPKIKKLDSLKAEKASSFMVGSDYYDKKFELSCNLYYTTIKDKIYFTDEGAPSGYDFVWTNAEEEAKVFSLELGGHYKIFDNLLFKSDLNLVRAKYDETTEVGEKNGENIRRTPQYTLGLGLEFMKNGWDIIFDGEIVGPMYIDLAWEEAGIDPSAIDEKVVQKTSTFSIWNIKVSKKLKKNTILFAGIKNLFDEVQENRSHKYDSVNGYEKIKAAAADAAFMYKPITGREMYCGMEIEF